MVEVPAADLARKGCTASLSRRPQQYVLMHASSASEYEWVLLLHLQPLNRSSRFHSVRLQNLTLASEDLQCIGGES
jgi:hypothetical protein